MDETRSGFAAIIGMPNAGKSTLMNKLLGEKLSIITNKPQTTRKRILGILSEKKYQIIFLDTPGILEPRYLLQKQLADYVLSSVNDADVLLVMLDLESDSNGAEFLNNPHLNKILQKPSPLKLLLINKIDVSDESRLNAVVEKMLKLKYFENIIPISALTGYNVDKVLKTIIELMPEHPKFFPDDQLSDADERFFVSEIIREKIFQIYSDEVPYSAEVVIEGFKERGEHKDFISASVVVEKESQKGILIGKKGVKIKRLGSLAREDVEKFLGREVFLEIRVKVRKNWRSDENMLRRFGYIRDEN